MKTMQIYFNGTPRRVAQGSSLQQALTSMAAPDAATPDQPMATAVNGLHVGRAQRASLTLAEGDQVTTFEPITGG